MGGGDLEAQTEQAPLDFGRGELLVAVLVEQAEEAPEPVRGEALPGLSGELQRPQVHLFRPAPAGSGLVLWRAARRRTRGCAAGSKKGGCLTLVRRAAARMPP
jgi:hypothetical protein